MISSVRIPAQAKPAGAPCRPAGFFAALAAAVLALSCPGAAAAPPELTVPATNVLDAVHARYAAVSNVSCTVRRSVLIGGKDGGSGESVSRIVWQRGDKLNVQRISPERRRTVIDGATVWTASDGQESPVSFPVSEQLPSQAANLRAVPGSPEEVLSVLDPATAEDLARAGDSAARRVAFAVSDEESQVARAVLSFDGNGFVASLQGYSDDAMATPLFKTVFSAPAEVLPGVMLFRKIVTESEAGGRTLSAVSSFERIRVNETLAPATFDAKAFFK